MYMSFTWTFTRFEPCSAGVTRHDQCVLIVTAELLFSQNCYGRLFSVYNHPIPSLPLTHSLSLPPTPSRSRRGFIPLSEKAVTPPPLSPLIPLKHFYLFVHYYVTCMIISLPFSLFFSRTGISHSLILFLFYSYSFSPFLSLYLFSLSLSLCLVKSSRPRPLALLSPLMYPLSPRG